MNSEELEKIELDLFLEALYRRYGYDFRRYARASIRRRARQTLEKSKRQRLGDLIPLLLQDEAFALQVVRDFSVTVTEMFRDPEFYRAVRQSVAPYLKTYPFVKVWVAGCSTGEEVYSLAILLTEEGLYSRAKIYATDINDAALQKAADGIYPLKSVRQYTANYQQAGGLASFADYYHAEYDSAIIRQELKANITFAHHNLATEDSFGEMHVVFCRNVLIYFDRSLQDRALSLFAESLTRGGFLCLGVKETLEFSPVASRFRVVDAAQRIYQKKA